MEFRIPYEKETNPYCREVNIVILGDEKVGKSTLIKAISYLAHSPGHFERPYYMSKVSSKMVSPFECNKLIGHRAFKIQIFDSLSGNTRFDVIQRKELYKLNPHLFIVCFAIDNFGSFENVIKKWIPEVNWETNNFTDPYVVVGTKSDLRENSNNNLIVNYREAKNFAKNNCNSIGYYECSSKTLAGVKKLFEEAFGIAACIQEEEIFFGRPKCCIV